MNHSPDNTRQAPKLEAVVFDLDGVLVHTDDHHCDSWATATKVLNIPCDRAFYDRRLRGLGRDRALDVILANAGRSLSPEEFNRCLAIKNDFYLRLLVQKPLPPAPGAALLVDALKQLGLCIAVGSSSRNARQLLQHIGMLELIDAIVDGNDAPGKPDPSIFLRAAALLELSPAECIVVEDADEGIRAAHKAGMAVVAIGPRVQFATNSARVPALEFVTIELLRSVHANRTSDA